MKTTERTNHVCLLVWLLAAGKLTAQPFTLDWFSVDGGSGSCSGGAYSVAGTIGQPDAGVMSGGNYTLAGGFWGAVDAYPQSSLPYLFIQKSNDVAVIWWSTAAPGTVVQASRSLQPGSWTTVPGATNSPITVPLSEQPQFFRLWR